MGFALLMNGVGDAFSLRHYGTSFLLERGEEIYAVDCPDLYRRALREHAFPYKEGILDVEHLDGLILTHLHGDHVNGLEMVLAYLRFVHHKKLKLYTSEEVAKDLWERRLAVSLGTMWDGQRFQSLTMADYLDLTILPWETPTAIGSFTVTTRRTLHHIPTMALRFTDGDASLGHSCDTAYDPTLIAWLEECDIFLHEANFGPAHTPLERLLELPESTRKKMLLVHYSDLLDLDLLDGITPARQGQRYPILAP